MVLGQYSFIDFPPSISINNNLAHTYVCVNTYVRMCGYPFSIIDVILLI